MVCPRSETPSLDRLDLGQGKFLKNKKINNFFSKVLKPRRELPTSGGEVAHSLGGLPRWNRRVPTH